MSVQVINNGPPVQASTQMDGQTLKIFLAAAEDDFASKMASGTGKYPKAVEGPYALKRRGG